MLTSPTLLRTVILQNNALHLPSFPGLSESLLSPEYMLFLGPELNMASEDFSSTQSLQGTAVCTPVSVGLDLPPSQITPLVTHLYLHGDRPTLGVLETSLNIAALSSTFSWGQHYHVEVDTKKQTNKYKPNLTSDA